MRAIGRLSWRALWLVLLASIGLHAAAWAHNGEDHGDAAPAPVTSPGASANMLTTYAVTEVFELLLKYPAPGVGDDATLRFFLADYATNRALDGAIDLAFSPAGVTIVKPPAMTSPGIFEAMVRFPADTVYSAVATVRSGRRTDFMELKNIYAGDHARHFLADHGGGVSTPVAGTGSIPWWGVVAAILLLALLGIVAWRRHGGSKISERSGVAGRAAVDRHESKEQSI